MSIINDIGDKITKGGSDVAQVTKNLAEIAKLTSKISDDKIRIDGLNKQLGACMAEELKDLTPAEITADLETSTDENKSFTVKNWKEIYAKVLDIKNFQNDIDKCNERISAIKKLVKCPQCGEMVPADAAFCIKCGFRLPETEKPVEVEQPKPGYCKSCGIKLRPGSKYCAECGTKVEEPAAETEKAAAEAAPDAAPEQPEEKSPETSDHTAE